MNFKNQIPKIALALALVWNADAKDNQVYSTVSKTKENIFEIMKTKSIWVFQEWNAIFFNFSLWWEYYESVLLSSEKPKLDKESQETKNIVIDNMKFRDYYRLIDNLYISHKLDNEFLADLKSEFIRWKFIKYINDKKNWETKIIKYFLKTKNIKLTEWIQKVHLKPWHPVFQKKNAYIVNDYLEKFVNIPKYDKFLEAADPDRNIESVPVVEIRWIKNVNWKINFEIANVSLEFFEDWEKLDIAKLSEKKLSSFDSFESGMNTLEKMMIEIDDLDTNKLVSHINKMKKISSNLYEKYPEEDRLQVFFYRYFREIEYNTDLWSAFLVRSLKSKEWQEIFRKEVYEEFSNEIVEWRFKADEENIFILWRFKTLMMPLLDRALKHKEIPKNTKKELTKALKLLKNEN